MVVQCVLDRTMITNTTIYNLTNIGLSIFAVICGKNRGVFVDHVKVDVGNTYSCLTLPPSYQTLLDDPTTTVTITTSNDIDLQFRGGNITGQETIRLLEAMNRATFDSSGDSGNAYDPYSCNLNGLSTYTNCPYGYNPMDPTTLQLHTTTVREHHSEHNDDDHHHHDHNHEEQHDRDVDMEIISLPKIRGVTTLGMFIPAHWAASTSTSSDNDGLLNYDHNDFTEMSNLGLNTILIPVPTDHAFWHPPNDNGHNVHVKHDASRHRQLLSHPGPKDKGHKDKEPKGPKGSKKEKEPKEPKCEKGNGDKSKKGCDEAQVPSVASKETTKHSKHLEPPVVSPPPTTLTRDVHYLLDILDQAHDSQLYVILQLVGSSNVDTVMEHVLDHVVMDHSETVIGIQLPTISMDDLDVDYSTMISTVRTFTATLPIFVPVSLGQLAHLKAITNHHAHIYTALSLDHTTAVADVASSTSLDDRMKLYYHENVACTQRSPIDYVGCYKNMPAVVTSGFDLAIDNCAFQHDTTTPFMDYGQCHRWHETFGSPWWHRHRQSLAVRQLASFELGLGWIFAGWKVNDDDDASEPGMIKTPAQLHSFKAVVAAGLFPDLHTYILGSSDLGDDIPACLNPPLDDFILGDETISPVPAPPPDCGNGWWNYTIDECSYWVPPPPPPPCPVCEECSFSNRTDFDETNSTDEMFYNDTNDGSEDENIFNATDEDSTVAEHSRDHHHFPNTPHSIKNKEERVTEGMSNKRFNRNSNGSSNESPFGWHHMGISFIAGILVSIATIAFIYEYKKHQDSHAGYEEIPN